MKLTSNLTLCRHDAKRRSDKTTSSNVRNFLFIFLPPSRKKLSVLCEHEKSRRHLGFYVVDGSRLLYYITHKMSIDSRLLYREFSVFCSHVRKNRGKGVGSLRTQRQLYSPPGELYCFAVIFVLRRVVFATQVYGRIEYNCSACRVISLLW